MKITKTKLEGVLIIEPENKPDERGEKCISYSKSEYERLGLSFNCVEERIYTPKSKYTLYGIHYQNKPYPQSKLMTCLKGKGMDYVVDLRKNSKTYLEWISVSITESNHVQVLIPSGYGHAFLSLEDNTQVSMKIDAYFVKGYSKQLKWNDSKINIDFGTINPVLATHDIVAKGIDEVEIDMD